MKTMPVRFFALLAIGVTFMVAPLYSQTATDLNMGATMAVGDTTPLTWRFSWWGKSGRHYLVQASLDLQTWSFLPSTNPSGVDAPITVVVPIDYDPTGTNSNSTEPKLFFRAVEFDPGSPPSTGNALADEWERYWFGATEVDAGADPDGDGLTNLQEFLLGTDPTLADTDGDGYADGVDHYPLDETKHAYAGSLTMSLVAPTGVTKLTSY